MAGDLSEIYERLAYCKKEVSRCRDELDAHFQSSVESRKTPVGATTFVEVRCNNPMPVAIRSRIGSIAHETRATLDELACRLAIRNQKSTTQTYFPIIKHDADFEKEATFKLKKLSDADRKVIMDLETHGDNRPFLFGMHDLDRIRKHQRSFLGLVATSDLFFGNGLMSNMAYERATVTDQWAFLLSYGSISTMEMSFSVAAAFSEPVQLKGMSVLPALSRFIQEVTEIVSIFD